ncbi:MAG: S9 family peptidase [Acidobacteria bacterium]|jgi:dipeptidyl-peptidase-4|nr:S9 family peptidase [Acidobacteriota bacterium]
MMIRPYKTASVSVLLFCFLVLTDLRSAAGDEIKSDPGAMLTLERIFDSPDFRVRNLGPTHWQRNGSGYTRLEKTAAKGIEGMDIVLVQPGRKKGQVLVSARQLISADSGKALKIEEYSWSDDGSRVMIFGESRPVWRQNTRGDYWVLNRHSGRLWKIGAHAEASSLMFAKFSPDSRQVAYVYKNDIYVETLSDDPGGRVLTRLTHCGSSTLINGTFDWVYEEEFDMRDGLRWSPDSRHIAYWQLDSSRVGIFHLINTTDTLYPVLTPIPYPKVGTSNSSCRIGIVPAVGGDTSWVELPGDPAEHYLPRMDWAASSSEIVLQRMNRKQNENQLILYNLNTRTAKTILTERDAAWLETVDDLQWLNQGREFTWTSERDGWRHLYVISRDGSAVRCITPGKYDVIRVLQIDDQRGWVYFSASPENPSQKYLYRVPLSGAEQPTRLTPKNLSGTNSYRICPKAAWAFHTYSNFSTPPLIQMISLPDHRSVTIFEDNMDLQKNLAEVRGSPVEFFDVDIGEGVQLSAWCLKPPDFDENMRYPVLFYVYGEPASQTVLDSYGRNTPWYRMLAQKGYIIMSVDNRGTPQPRGRDWRKSVHRQIGILASADQAAATRAIIASRPYIDPDRVGVWGWSGGGSMTLNLMFRHPELYKTGMSVAPVPDQRLYDTIYQERFMELPADNEEGYASGSPISFAHQLQGNLLIVHGTGDDNVHYQGTERLINKLIENGKHFTMMAYPNRSHGIFEGKNTTLHLYRLLTRYLISHLEPGGVKN